MVIIQDINSDKFSLDGIPYLKNFLPVVNGNNLRVVNTYDSKIVISDYKLYSEYSVNGTVYNSITELQDSLLDILYSRVGFGVGLAIEEKTDTGGYLGTSQDLKNSIDNAVFSGAVTYETLADFNAVSPVPDDGTPFVIANDPNDDNNGDWSVQGGLAVQNDRMIENEVDYSNTTKGVTGRAVDLALSFNAKKGFKETGYIDKNTGAYVSSVNYLSTPFLRYLGGDLTVTGYSGNANPVGLLVMYNNNKKFIGYINEGSGASINSTNYTIAEASIDSECYFVRSSAAISQTDRRVSGNVSLSNNQIDYIKTISESVANQYFNFDEAGYTHKISGAFVPNGEYNTTPFLRYLGGDLTVTGYSGSNSVGLIVMYSKNQNYLGYINESGAPVLSESYVIPESDIDANCYFVKANATINQTSRHISGNLTVGDVLIKDNKDSIEINNSKIYNFENIATETKNFNIEGYTNKTTGNLTASSSYRTTPFFRYVDGDLVVSGFSGNINNAALMLMYDRNYKYIGFFNQAGAVNIDTNNLTILESEIDYRCVYVKFNAASYQTYRRVSGHLELIDSALDYVFEKAKPRNIFELLNNRLKLTFHNYLGNTENIHPKVIYDKDNIFGYPFWMAYTPYPNGSTVDENPCIAVSRDGIDWEAPTGLTNPITPVPSGIGNYNSDTHLLYREDTNVLECWYRPVVGGQDSIVRKTTTDGVTWSAEEVIIPQYAKILSPAIIFEDNKYTMVGVRLNSSPYKVFRMKSTDDTATSWGAKVDLPINWGTVIPWHIDVEKTDLGYEYVIQAYESGNNNNSSDLYYVLEDLNGNFTDPVKIIQRNPFDAWDDRGIYRSCLLKLFGGYFVYYSGIRENGQRSMGLMSGKNILELK